MNRAEFMNALNGALNGLPQAEIDKAREYYDELFSDGLEAGRTEEDICAGLDHPEVIAGRIRGELGLQYEAQSGPQQPQQPQKKTKLALIIVLAVFAIPIGAPILIAVAATLFALLVALTSVIFAVVVSMIAVGAAGIGLFVISLYTLFSGGFLAGLALLGASLICIGISILGVILCASVLPKVIKSVVKGIGRLFSSFFGWIRGKRS